MYSYIKALEKLVYELGGRIMINNPVSEILISHTRAAGVKLESAVEKADIVVCTSDFPYSMKQLIKDKKAKGKYTDERLDKMDYSCSTFILYLGLKKKYPQLVLHNLYMGNHFKECIEQAFTGYLPQDPTLYIYCPSSIDESMAPTDMECLSITVRVPNLSFGKIKWDEDRVRSLRYSILNQLSRIKGLEDIEENIVFEEYLTPLDLSSRFNSYHGTAFGLSPTLIQSNYFRPKIKSPRVDNLYFVGNSVHPGNGISLVLLSSRIAAEEILKNI
jgi:phytoene desaturase